MDIHLARLMDDDTPKLNPILANGLAVEHLKEAEHYVDSTFRALQSCFPPGFVYHGGHRCTPEEEFSRLHKAKNGNRKSYDISRSDIYLMRYMFSFHGEEIPCYISLPFVGEAGIMFISGSRYLVSPILADPLFSIGMHSIFMRFRKARPTFQRTLAHYIANNARESLQVAYTEIYNKRVSDDDQDDKQDTSAKTTLGHYLFAKYGFTEAMSRYGKCSVVVGKVQDITPELYPPDQWVICRSTGNRPRKVNNVSTVAVAVPLAEYGVMAKNLLAAFFYAADHFPLRLTHEWVDSVRQWRLLLGRILLSPNTGEGMMATQMDEHIESLDEYVDDIIKDQFNELGMVVEDLYDVFATVIDKFNEWLATSDDAVSTMYGKELSILYYLLAPITMQIHKFYFRLMKLVKRPEPLTKKDIETAMYKIIKAGLIYSINRKNGEVSPISYPGDNKAFKLTAMLVPQTSSSKSTKKADNINVDDPALRLHASISEIGGYSNMPKAEPSGRHRLNRMVELDERSRILRNPNFVEMLDKLQEDIKPRNG